jgi:hypothetical protein
VSDIDRMEHQGYIDPSYEDPLLLAGHCFLALAAAGLGSLFAPMVCDRTRQQAGAGTD